MKVKVKVFYRGDKNFIHFFFRNKLTYQLAATAAKEWKAICDNNPDRTFVHIWDCQNMSGYEQKAKSLWLEHLDIYSHQTEKIILISDNIFVRGAARIMSRFSQKNCMFIRRFWKCPMQSSELRRSRPEIGWHLKCQ